MHKEALGTRTRLWPLGGGRRAWAVAFTEEMAPGKVKDQGLGNAGAPWRSLILG